MYDFLQRDRTPSFSLFHKNGMFFMHINNNNKAMTERHINDTRLTTNFGNATWSTHFSDMPLTTIPSY